MPRCPFLFARKDIEAIIISVPHHLIPEKAISAMKVGKHVLCEKPMGKNLTEARSIMDSIHEVVFEPGFNYRFYPGIQKVHELIQHRAVGDVADVRCVLGHGGRPGMEKEWKTSIEFCGGGALLDPGIHGIDLFRFLFGEITEGILWTKNSFWDLEVEDNAFALLRTASDQTISAHFSITEWKSLFRLEVFGTDGYMILEGRSRSYGPQTVRFGKRWFWLDSTEEQKWDFSVEDTSFYEELKAFLEKIEGKENSCLAAPGDGLRAMEIVEKLYEAEGKQIKLE